MTKNIGGPAFPHEYKYGDGTAHRHDGMPLRDYFAAKAMQGYIAARTTLDNHAAGVRPYNEAEVADGAYAMADAMLQEREK